MIRRLGALLLAIGLGLGLPETSESNPLVKVGIGAYGVSTIPIAQDDADPGGLFGIRGRVGLLSMLMFEPSVNFIKNQDKDFDINGEQATFEAPEITSFAFNLLLKGGPMYTTGGIGWSSVDVPGGVGKSDEPTYNFGGGVELGFGALAIDVSPRLFIINTEEKASRKNLAIMAGATYYFF